MTSSSRKFTQFSFVLLFSLLTNVFVYADHGQFNKMRLYAGAGPNFSNTAMGQFIAGVDFPLHSRTPWHFSVGPSLGLLFTSNLFGIDLDASLKALYRINVGKNLGLGIYARAPVGVSMLVTGGFSMGFNVGVIPGVEFYFDESLGLFGELGFHHHSLFGITDTARLLGAMHLPHGVFAAGILWAF